MEMVTKEQKPLCNLVNSFDHRVLWNYTIQPYCWWRTSKPPWIPMACWIEFEWYLVLWRQPHQSKMGSYSSTLHSWVSLSKMWFLNWQSIVITWIFRAKFAQVILGAHNLYESTNQPNYVTMKVDKFYDHPDYEATSIVNDVALIELPTDVQYTGNISWNWMKLHDWMLFQF